MDEIRGFENLSDLVRKVDPTVFDSRAFPSGQLVIYDRRKSKVVDSSISLALRRRLDPDNFDFIFLTFLESPVVLSGIEYVWKDGTTNTEVPLAISCRIQLQNSIKHRIMSVARIIQKEWITVLWP